MSKNIYLEKFTFDDFDKYYELLSNEDVMAMITERAIPLENFKLVLNNNQMHEVFGNFKVMETYTNKFIGSALLKIKEKNSSEAQLGYMLLPDYWGNGIGSEVARMLIEKAKGEKQLIEITAIIDPNNIASRKILINNGFKSIKVCEIGGLPGEILNMKIQ